MKAIQIVKPGVIEIIHRERPSIKKSNEVVIKVRMAGICGSDMHIYHGTSPVATYPRVIGHEITGEVIETGNKVKGLLPGDKVVIEPIKVCGECYACRNGRQNVCANLQVFGVHFDGGFQEYVVLPDNMVHKVNSDLAWEEAVLVEPFTIGAQANWRGNVRKSDTVFIMGAGPIGLCILQIAKHIGAICIVSDLNEEKLHFAKKLGADCTINSRMENVVKKVKEITDGFGANVTIDAVGIPQTFEQSVEVTSVAGRIVVMGFTNQSSRICQFPITKKELTISGSRLQTNQFPEVIQLLNDKEISGRGLVSHYFQFYDVAKAIQLIENHSEKVRKVVLKF